MEGLCMAPVNHKHLANFLILDLGALFWMGPFALLESHVPRSIKANYVERNEVNFKNGP